ncbi:MAG: FumA C-terminus/TtdB family hydratase beta subunit [Clostridia bacterium]|nr:FumA C-terminus/TtdB family hydratase beta subunit [Clostridia bacterium]
MTKEIHLPLSKEDIRSIKAGDTVYISGTIYTARDCAHKRMTELLDAGKELPIVIEGAFIYYAGPCPAREGNASGSCGPTTSARMESFAPRLLDLGLSGMIGKGEMDEKTREAIKRNGGVYFAAIGGAGALYGKRVKSSELVAFPDLLSEGIYRLEVERFPAVAAIDFEGRSIYDGR